MLNNIPLNLLTIFSNNLLNTTFSLNIALLPVTITLINFIIII